MRARALVERARRALDAVLEPWPARWIVLPLVAGTLFGVSTDARHLPLWGAERMSEIVLVDGQIYLGHLSEPPFSDQLVLRDVHYFQDGRQASANTALVLVRRGSEVHRPADGLRVRRDKVLLIEEVGPASQVMRAIATERSLERAVPK